MNIRRNTTANPGLPIAVIGAGPIGLAAAAHLASRGQPFVVLEAGQSVGAHVSAWSHVQVFSPWRYNVDPVAGAMLMAAGWKEPDRDVLPTGGELVAEYLRPLGELPQIAPAPAAGHTCPRGRPGRLRQDEDGRARPGAVRAARPLLRR